VGENWFIVNFAQQAGEAAAATIQEFRNQHRKSLLGKRAKLRIGQQIKRSRFMTRSGRELRGIVLQANRKRKTQVLPLARMQILFFRQKRVNPVCVQELSRTRAILVTQVQQTPQRVQFSSDGRWS